MTTNAFIPVTPIQAEPTHNLYVPERTTACVPVVLDFNNDGSTTNNVGYNVNVQSAQGLTDAQTLLVDTRWMAAELIFKSSVGGEFHILMPGKVYNFPILSDTGQTLHFKISNNNTSTLNFYGFARVAVKNWVDPPYEQNESGGFSVFLPNLAGALALTDASGLAGYPILKSAMVSCFTLPSALGLQTFEVSELYGPFSVGQPLFNGAANCTAIVPPTMDRYQFIFPDLNIALYPTDIGGSNATPAMSAAQEGQIVQYQLSSAVTGTAAWNAQLIFDRRLSL